MSNRVKTALRSISSRHVLHTLAALGTCTALLVSFTSSPKAQTPVAAAPAAPAMPFRDYVSGAALVESAGKDVLVASPVSGVVASVHVRVGDSVKAGDPLFTVDQRDAEAELQTRSASLAVARAELAELEEASRKATLEDQRLAAVDDARAVSDEERATRRSALRTATARVTTAQAKVEARVAELAAARVALAERVVRAPISGQVLGVAVRAGESVGGGNASAPVRLGNVERLHVRVDIDENDAWRITPGTRARLVMRGNSALTSDLRYEYTERYVRPKTSLTGASTERVDTRVLQLVYSLPAKALPLYVGQQVDVIVEVVETPRDGNVRRNGGTP